MGKMSFDPADAALTVALLVSGFIMVGMASFSIYGIDFGATVFSVGGFDISTAYLMSVGAFVGTIATNDNAQLDSLADDVKQLDDYYMYAIAASVVLLGAWLVLPQVANFFQSADTWGLLYVAVTTTGQFALGWIL